jgi:phospholipid/cholesterol/gamma-HCH transport system substrate-binding protein
MRSNRINYVTVGGFVLAMLAGLVVSLALVTGRTGATEEYYTVFDNVTGVKYGTQVLYEGYNVGQIERIAPLEEQGRMRFKVSLGIAKGWKIPEDSVAEIAASGLLAAVSVNIDAGESRLFLKPGATIRSREGANIIVAMATVAATVNDLTERHLKPLLVNLDASVRAINALLDGEGREMVLQFNALARELNAKAPAIIANIEEFAANANATSGDVKTVLANVDKAAANFAAMSADLADTRRRLDALLDAATGTLADNRGSIDKALADLRYVMESVSRHVDAINQNLEGASRNMYEFSRHIRQNPGLLLGGTPPRDEADGRPAATGGKK